MVNGVTLEQLAALRDDLKRDIAVEQPKFSDVVGVSDVVSGALVCPAESQAEVARLQSALAVLSSDVPRGSGSLYEHEGGPISGDYWLLVIWGIRSLGWVGGEAIAREWSMRCMERYDDGSGFDAAWESYDPARNNALGIGSLYALAKHHGWEWRAALTATQDWGQREAANAPCYKLLTSKEIAALPPICWLVKGVLPDHGVAAIFGPSGSGKSFLALDLARSIAEASDEYWFGHKVHRAPVVYVMLEGEGGLRNRVAAIEKKLGHSLSDSFRVVLQPFRVNQSIDVEALAQAVPKGAVVFIDTLNRAAPGANENAPEDMSLILEGAKRLATEIYGLVLLVHHTGKDESKGMRGHSSLHAGLDAEIEVTRKGDRRAWSVAKSKDGEDGQAKEFKLNRVVLGHDQDGDEISSCTVEWDQTPVFRRPEPKGKNQKAALKAIRDALRSDSGVVMGAAGSSAETPCLTGDDAISVIAATLTDKTSNKRNYEAKRLVKELQASGHLTPMLDDDDVVWISVE